jgi:hypothetical protein
LEYYNKDEAGMLDYNFAAEPWIGCQANLGEIQLQVALSGRLKMDALYSDLNKIRSIAQFFAADDRCARIRVLAVVIRADRLDSAQGHVNIIVVDNSGQ